jgi:hypothetical protein
MIWGIGTGRCGTRSLAVELGGVHEPQPWFGPESVAAYWGDHAAQAACQQRLAARAALPVPVVSDLHQSWLIPLICEVDSQAHFIWMIRNPAEVVASFLAGNGWTAQNQYGASLWRPQGGWPESLSRFGKALTYWLEVNRLIAHDLQACGAPWERRLTSSLQAHENRYPTSPDWRFTPQETARLVEACGGLWARWRLPGAGGGQLAGAG